MPRLLLLFEHEWSGSFRAGKASLKYHLKVCKRKKRQSPQNSAKQNKYNKKGQQKQCACFDRHSLLNCPVFLNVGGEGPQISVPRNTNAPFLVYVSAMDKKADGRER